MTVTVTVKGEGGGEVRASPEAVARAGRALSCIVAKEVYSSETRTSLCHGCSACRSTAFALLCVDMVSWTSSAGLVRSASLRGRPRRSACRPRSAPFW